MKSFINKIFNKNKNKVSDLTPRGIRSTIKSKDHGTVEDFNNSWRHIGSQLRNVERFIEEYKSHK